MARSSYTSLTEAQAQTNQPAGFLSPDATMVLLTWITFLLLLVILQKFAWRPILAHLEAREEKIRRSLQEAEQMRQEVARFNQTKHMMMEQAHQQAQEVIDRARQAAKEAASVIKGQAKEQARILLENARRDIREETEKARSMLREESKQIAIDLAGKLMEENLDNEKNHAIVNRLIQRI